MNRVHRNLSRRARVATGGAVLAEADTASVGQAAFAAGIPLTELRAADGAGLEEMFLALTADREREGKAA